MTVSFCHVTCLLRPAASRRGSAGAARRCRSSSTMTLLRTCGSTWRHRLQVDAVARHLGRLAVGLVEGVEQRRRRPRRGSRGSARSPRPPGSVCCASPLALGISRLYSDCAWLISFSFSCCASLTALKEGLTGSGGLMSCSTTWSTLDARLVLVAQLLQLDLRPGGHLGAARRSALRSPCGRRRRGASRPRSCRGTSPATLRTSNRNL